jgi:hypothetical protein
MRSAEHLLGSKLHFWPANPFKTTAVTDRRYNQK